MLVALSRGKKVSVRLAERSAIVLLAAEGKENMAIAARLKITRQKVARWRDRYAEQGIKGIEMDAPRSGRMPKISSALKKQVIEKTLREKPAAATHWSRSTMAAASGLSDSTIGRIWKAHGLKPAFKPHFQALQRPALRRKAGGHRGALPEPTGTCGGVFLR